MTENFFERTFYNVRSKPQPPRTTPMKVICPGISRSATESLRRALIELGYNTYHGFEIFNPGHEGDFRTMSLLARKKFCDGPKDGSVGFTAEDFDQLYGSYDAVTDVPGYSLARELILTYPEAKVILNVRNDLDAWHKSILATFGAAEKSWTVQCLKWFSAKLYWTDRFGIVEHKKWFFRGDFKTNGKWIYEEHSAMIRGLVPKERLLEWTVQDGWEPLCKFLGKEVPDKEFPSGNMGAGFMQWLHERQKEQYQTAIRNISIAGIAFVSMAVGGFKLARPEAFASLVAKVLPKSLLS